MAEEDLILALMNVQLSKLEPRTKTTNYASKTDRIIAEIVCTHACCLHGNKSQSKRRQQRNLSAGKMASVDMGATKPHKANGLHDNRAVGRGHAVRSHASACI